MSLERILDLVGGLLDRHGGGGGDGGEVVSYGSL